MSIFPAVILSKSNNITAADETPWMTPAVEQAFADYVHQGGGLLALHSGTAGYQHTPHLRSLLGGVFAHHPEQCPVSSTPDSQHPLAQGVEPFTLKDEHYFMEMGAAEVDIFMTTQSSHGSQPGGWTRRQGRGRVCVLTPGHNLDVWQHPSYQNLITNTLRWVAQAA
jgi:type 1 glutamine amidotransferase